MTITTITNETQEMEKSGILNKTYDARTVVGQILNKYPNIRSTQEYKNKKFELIEDTMSCDKEEQVSWMNWFMLNALFRESKAVKYYNSLTTKTQEAWHNTCVNRKLAATQFIAAYDLM